MKQGRQRTAPNGWREKKELPGKFFALHRRVRKVHRVPKCALQTSSLLEDRQARNPQFPKIVVGYGGRKRPARDPEQKGIAELAGISRSSAIRGVQWLEANGFLYRDIGRGRSNANNYWPGPELGGGVPPVQGPWDDPEYDPRAYREQLLRHRKALRAATEALTKRGPPPRAPLRLQ